MSYKLTKAHREYLNNYQKENRKQFSVQFYNDDVKNYYEPFTAIAAKAGKTPAAYIKDIIKDLVKAAETTGDQQG